MKVLITGATGLVGKHLVNKLLEENCYIVALGRDQFELEKLKNLGVNIITFDLTDNKEFEKLNSFGDFIWIHVAAAISGASKEILDKVNVIGTELLVKKAETLQIPKFILISSISTYSINLTGKVKSNAEQNPESYYGQTKLAQEKILKNSSLTYSIIRPPYIGGPFDQNFLEEFTKRIEKKKMPTFSKNGKISYVDARDLADAIHLLLITKESEGKSYNIISEVISHKELVAEIGSQVEISPPYGPHYQYWFAMIVGFFGEIFAKLQGKSSERSISRYRIRTLCRKFELDPDNLIQDTGYSPNYTIKRSISDWLKTREPSE